MSFIKFKTSDGHVVSVEAEITKCSETIKEMLDTLGEMDENEEEIILENINKNTLDSIIEWCKHQATQNSSSNGETQWESEFISIHQSNLPEIVRAAHFLGIQKLEHLALKLMAKEINLKYKSIR